MLPHRCKFGCNDSAPGYSYERSDVGISITRLKDSLNCRQGPLKSLQSPNHRPYVAALFSGLLYSTHHVYLLRPHRNSRPSFIFCKEIFLFPDFVHCFTVPGPALLCHIRSSHSPLKSCVEIRSIEKRQFDGATRLSEKCLYTWPYSSTHSPSCLCYKVCF